MLDALLEVLRFLLIWTAVAGGIAGVWVLWNVDHGRGGWGR